MKLWQVIQFIYEKREFHPYYENSFSELHRIFKRLKYSLVSTVFDVYYNTRIQSEYISETNKQTKN